MDCGDDTRYVLQTRMMGASNVLRKLQSEPFGQTQLVDGRVSFSRKWLPDQLWDVHTPENMFQLQLSLLNKDAVVVDTAHGVKFGFREFWIDGRDFYLHGTRIFLSAVPLDNAQVGAAWATYDAARESMTRLAGFGINFVYTHNYGCEPGMHLSFEQILRAADVVGMLVGFSQLAPSMIAAAPDVMSNRPSTSTKPGTVSKQLNRTNRRVTFLTVRLLANMGVAASTPVLERCSSPVVVTAESAADSREGRWLEGLCVDTPEEWDAPYRFSVGNGVLAATSPIAHTHHDSAYRAPALLPGRQSRCYLCTVNVVSQHRIVSYLPAFPRRIPCKSPYPTQPREARG